jgi:hypothetical protein
MSIDEKALKAAAEALTWEDYYKGSAYDCAKATIEAYEAAKASERPAFLKDWEIGGHTKAHLISDHIHQPVGIPPEVIDK